MDAVLVRYRTDDKDLFEDVEGLTPVGESVFFVRDKGGKADADDERWFVLERVQLGFED